MRRNINDILWLGFKKTKAKLHALLKDWPEDYITVLGFISEYYFTHFDKKQLTEQIAMQTYDFDQTTISELKKMPQDKMREEIYKIMSKICVEKDIDPAKINIPNVFQPCELTNSTFCEGSKLIVNTSIEKMCDILGADLRDPLRSKYLLDSIWKDTVINYFDFAKQPMEVINIYRLTV